jgi:hypothetical protein
MAIIKSLIFLSALSVGVGAACGTSNDAGPSAASSTAGSAGGAGHIEMIATGSGGGGGPGSAGAPTNESDASATGSSDAMPMTMNPGPSCDGGVPSAPSPNGATIDVQPPATLATALGKAHPGDRIVLHAGTYTAEQISGRAFADYVFIEAANSDQVTIPGLTFTKSDHVSIKGVHFAGTVKLDGSSNFIFNGVTLDGGATEDAALQIHGQSSAGASHDVLVEDSKILGGGRTIFVLGAFAPSDKWNHHLTFVRNDITCGSHNCWQVSGGRDMLIADNKINGTTTDGVLTAGGTRISIVRNRFHGMGSKPPAAAHLASPGMEWDNYAGVENMISSAILVADNIADGWANFVQLDAARDIAIVYNTVADGVGVRLNHRTPHDQSGNVILDGNSNVRVWNDILPSILVASGEMQPVFEMSNLVGMPPAFASATDFTLAPGSTAVDKALVNMETPLYDFDNHLRGDHPDIGARELGATAPACEGQP